MKVAREAKAQKALRDFKAEGRNDVLQCVATCYASSRIKKDKARKEQRIGKFSRFNHKKMIAHMKKTVPDVRRVGGRCDIPHEVVCEVGDDISNNHLRRCAFFPDWLTFSHVCFQVLKMKWNANGNENEHEHEHGNENGVD